MSQVLTFDEFDEIERRQEELFAALEGSPFWAEFLSYGVVGFYIDPFDDESLANRIDETQQLIWIRGLVAPDFAAVHMEVFDWFSHRSERLSELHWREFEELVAAAFVGQGMTVELGSGGNDGGIDLKLVKHEVFGDVLTAVQVKSGNTPVRLHFVQALAAASEVDGNDESLFVTSSRFLPGASKWAGEWEKSRSHPYSLATAEDVSGWLAVARDRMWLPNNVLRDPEPRGSGHLVGRILLRGSSPIRNQFGQVVRQTPRALLMRVVGQRAVDGDTQQGLEVPEMASSWQPKVPVYVAARLDPETGSWISTDGDLYSEWDGQPVWFDILD